jgi:hypothetical protein
MSNYSRREFLGLSALLAGGKLEPQKRTASVPSAQTTSSPDLVLVNGRVFTSDPSIPRAQLGVRIAF